MRAMVFAAGLGKRLRPITATIPKPLVQVGGKTMLDWTLDQLARAGITHAVVNASYLAEQVVAHVSARTSSPDIIVSVEEGEPLETGGGIVKALAHLKDAPFFAMNSDVICIDGPNDPMLTRMQAAWDATRMDGLLLLCKKEKAIGYSGAGDFFLEGDGSLRMRTAQEDSAPYVFTGAQILSPTLFATPPSQKFSLNVFYRALSLPTMNPARMHGIVHDGDWLHIGDADGLKLAEDYFAQRAA